jgi:hypothetical protein
MAKIKNPDLTVKRVKELLHYDQETGVFYWLADRSIKTKAGDRAGSLCPTTKYIRIIIDHKRVKAHRLAWFYSYGEWPGLLDHEDGVKSNNKLSNLRECSTSENAENQGRFSSNKLGARGVQFKAGRSKPYQAKITVCGKIRTLGHYATVSEASDAYMAAKKEYHSFYSGH